MLSHHPEVHHAILEARTFWDDPQKFVLLSLYEQRMHRRFRENTKLLAEKKKERELKQALDLKQEKPKAMAAGAADLSLSDRNPAQSPVTPGQEGTGLNLSDQNPAQTPGQQPAQESTTSTPNGSVYAFTQPTLQTLTPTTPKTTPPPTRRPLAA
jgi:hypothetical protein